MKSKIVKKIREKVSRGKELLEDVDDLDSPKYEKRNEAIDILRTTYPRWFHSTKGLLEKIEISENKPIEEFSSYGKEIKTLANTASDRDKKKIRADLQHQISLLESIVEIYEDIDPIDVKSAVEKGVYEDELGQASGLLEGNHIIPAASVTRMVFLNSLKSISQKNDLEPKEGIHDLLIMFKEEDIISKIEFREMQKWNDILNAVRYDDEEEIDHGDISEVIDKVDDFVERLEIKS